MAVDKKKRERALYAEVVAQQNKRANDKAQAKARKRERREKEAK